MDISDIPGLSYYIKAKKEGWKPDKYDVEIIFNPSIKLNFENLTYIDLVLTIMKYKNFNLTFEAKIKENGKELNFNDCFQLLANVNKDIEIMEYKWK